MSCLCTLYSLDDCYREKIAEGVSFFLGPLEHDERIPLFTESAASDPELPYGPLLKSAVPLPSNPIYPSGPIPVLTLLLPTITIPPLLLPD